MCAPHLYYIDDVMVMNIIKWEKFLRRDYLPNVWPDQPKNASAVPVGTSCTKATVDSIHTGIAKSG